MRPWKVLLLVVGLATCWFVGLGVYTGYRALKADPILVFGKIACLAVNDYVKSHDGKWPRSWDELRESEPSEHFRGTATEYADLVRSMQKNVVIDFTASESEIAECTIEDFDAIRPIEWPYESWSPNEYWDVAALLETMRSFHAQKSAP